MKKVYICGAYTAPDDAGILENVKASLQYAHSVAAWGAHPVVPHVAFPGVQTWDEAMQSCQVMLGYCDWILMTEGWMQSRGAMQELCWAHENGQRIFFSLEELSNALANEVHA